MTLPRMTLTPYSLLLLASAAILVVLSLWVFLTLSSLRSRSRRPAVLLGCLLLTAAVWCVSYGFQIYSPTVEAAGLWANVRTLGPTLAAPIAFLFAVEYTNREAWFRRRRLLALFSLAAVTQVLAWTNDRHGLVRRDLIPDGGGLYTNIVPGAWGAVYASYDYALMLAAFYLLARAYRDGSHSRVYRGQIGAILVAILLPTVANVAWFLGLTPIDGTPIAFGAAALVFATALYRYRLLDILPIARTTVFENVDLGALVVDADDTVVDVNAYARALFDPNDVLGTSLEELLASLPEEAGRLADVEDGSDRVELTNDGRSRWFDVDVTPLTDSLGRPVGRVFLFKEVTDRVHRQRELRRRTAQLERQNEKLDRFASIVSHDLRNPLNVAQGHLDLAREDPSTEHLDQIDGAIDRMAGLIDDVLALAQQTEGAIEREQVDLGSLAAEAWANVDSADATLACDLEFSLQADPSRLLQIFENLFRNALDHGPDDVTVRVGPLPAEPTGGRDGDGRNRDGDGGHRDRDGRPSGPPRGFFVEDDGPGIPDDERETVFERGYTTARDGTGLGLAIVETAVETHGWSISASESSTGGARFEVLTADAHTGPTGLPEASSSGPDRERQEVD